MPILKAGEITQSLVKVLASLSFQPATRGLSSAPLASQSGWLHIGKRIFFADGSNIVSTIGTESAE
jgi:hypothetical protein